MARHFLANVGSLSGSRMVIYGSQILILPIVARYLEIADFGDVALSMTVVLFAQLVSDAGLSRSLVRRERYDPAEWSSVFWFLTALGTVLAGVLLAIAPAWSWLFDRPAIGPLVSALAAVPFLLAVSAVPMAALERADRFPTIATVNACAAGVGFAVAVSLAVAGAGPWALAGQQIAIAAVQAGAVTLVGGFRPLSPRHRVPLGNHLIFARNTLAVSFLFTAQRQVPMMMIGYWLGAGALGLFSMGQRILNLPVTGLANPTAQVSFVRMSRVQDDPARVGALFVASLRLLALAILPPMAVLAGIGETAFPLLLSDQWREVALIFALAAPGIALEAAHSSAGVMFQAINRTDLRLRMALERVALRLVAVAVALPFGLAAVAAAVGLSALAYLPRTWALVRQVTTVDRTAPTRAIAAPVFAAAVLFAACRWLQAEFDGWATLGGAALLLAAVWLPLAVASRRHVLKAISAFSA